MVKGVERRGNPWLWACAMISGVGCFPLTSTTAATPAMTDVRMACTLQSPVNKTTPSLFPVSRSLMRSVAAPLLREISIRSWPTMTSACKSSLISLKVRLFFSMTLTPSNNTLFVLSFILRAIRLYRSQRRQRLASSRAVFSSMPSSASLKLLTRSLTESSLIFGRTSFPSSSVNSSRSTIR